MMEFSLTQRGNCVLLYQGFEYTKYRENRSGIITWRCRTFFATKCRAFIRLQAGNILGEVPQHCHDSNPLKAQANILVAAMKEGMKAIGATPGNVIGNALLDVNSDILEHLPKQSSLTRSLFKSKITTYIPNPTATNFPIPEKYADVVLYDTGVNDPDRILAIGSNDLLLELNKDVLYGDGTYDKAPSIFYQLFTWHAKVGNSYPPCIYFLLKKKNMDTYDRMFTILKQLVPNIMPEKILLDFEKACMSAAQVAFPQAEVTGCYFHLCQSVIRKIHSVGLKTVYESDPDIRLRLKSLSALSFVPIPDVDIVFAQLVATFPDEENYNEVLTYFSSTYITGITGRQPLFPIQVWNHFEAVAEICPKTTNCCEGFHNTLNSLFHCSHPSIWNVLDGLRKNIICQQLLLTNALEGQPEVKRKRYEIVGEQVAKVVQGYQDQPDKLRFLRQMANIH